MRRFLSLLALLPLAVLLQGNADRNATKLYRGAWFDVRYPSTFKVVKTGEEDGASFRSPDRAVTFYVYSPQWNGESTWSVRRADETLVDSTVEVKGQLTATRVTCRSAAGLRSWEQVENRELNVRHVFGIACRDQKTLKNYRTQYLAFKRSLRQYAD